MNVEVNYLAVFLAAVSSMVVGSVWYAKGVFGDTWAKLVKLDDKKMRAGMIKALGLAFVLALLMAYILAHLAFLSHNFFHHSFMQDAVTTAFWAWLGVAFTRTVTHDAFEQRPLKLTLMNTGNMLVTMLLMGVVIGWLKP
jgi:hypothetical protein